MHMVNVYLRGGSLISFCVSSLTDVDMSDLSRDEGIKTTTGHILIDVSPRDIVAWTIVTHDNVVKTGATEVARGGAT